MGHKAKCGTMATPILFHGQHIKGRDVGRDERECILAEWCEGVLVPCICHRHGISRRQVRRILRDMAGYDVDAYERDMDLLTEGGR